MIAIPVVFTLMSTYLFGGALAVSPGRYLAFILPGTLVMVWRAAPIAGTLLGDIARYLLAGALVTMLGVAIGYRPAGGAPGCSRGSACLCCSLSACPGPGPPSAWPRAPRRRS
jgi:ABC-2 type transport system permease protein